MRIATLLAFTATMIACSTFGSDDPDPGATTPPGVDVDGGGADGSQRPVDGKPGVLAPTVAGPVRITQGGGARAHVTINRGGIDGPIRVTATTSPTGVVVKDVVLSGTTTEGDLELTALGNAPQGTASVALKASTTDGTTATASFDVFVRGGVGTVDTTFGVTGVSDLGPATFAGGKRSAKNLFVSTGTIRRFGLDGAPDGAFAPIADSSLIFSVAKDESLFVGVPAPRHYLPSGAADAAYSAAAIPAGDIAISRALAVNAAYEAVVFGNNGTLSDLRAVKLTSTGAIAGDFTFPVSTHPIAGSTAAFFIEPLADGSFVVATGESQLGGLSVAHILATGALDPAFAGGSTFGDAVVGPSGIPLMFDFRATTTAFYAIGQTANSAAYGLAKFESDGTLSTAFGETASPGVARPPPRPIVAAATGGLDVDSQGRVITATLTAVGGANLLTVSRFTSAGKHDTSLSPSGFVTFAIGTTVSPRRVFVVDDERVLVLGLRDGNGFIARFWM